MQCNEFNTIHDTIRYDTIQYNTIQYNIITDKATTFYLEKIR